MYQTHLTYSLMLSMLLFILAVYFAIKYFLALKTIKTKTHDDELKDVIISAVNGGYYYWDASTNSELFSVNLRSLFNLQREVSSFKDISELFRHNQDVLDDYLKDLKESKLDDFNYKLSKKINGKTNHYNCVANKILNNDGECLGVIIWFFDVTEYTSRIRSSIAQNKKLRENLDNFSYMLNQLEIPIWQHDKNEKIIFYNKTYAKFIFDDDLIEDNGDVPELDSGLKNNIKNITGCNNIIANNKHLVCQGQRRLYEVSQQKLLNHKYLSYAIDITKQEELQKKLESHISAHSDLLESTSSAIAIFRSDTKLEFYNNTFKRLWGLEDSWLNSKPYYSELLIKLRDERKLPEQSNFKNFREQHLQMFQNLIEPHNEFMYLPDGKSIRTIVIPHAMGGLLFVYEDLTDHLAMQSSYNTLIEVQKETLRNLSEGVLVIEEDGKVRLYNPALIKLWPNITELINKLPHVNEIIEESKKFLQYEGSWEQFKKTIVSDLSARVHKIREYRTKNQKYLLCSIVPLPDGATLVSFIDTTDSKLVELTLLERAEALEKVDSLKTQFLTNVSYELRAPLTTIMGFSEALYAEMFGKLNEKQAEYVNNIYDASRHLTVLINDVIDLASIEAGYMTLNIREFNIKSALMDIANVMQSNNKDITLNTYFDDNVLNMIGDENRIKQIAFNLIDKGLKLMPIYGQAMFRLKKTDNNQIAISFEVVTENDLNKSNDEIVVIHNILSDKFNKNFGLSVVKNIVELHEGVFEINDDKSLNPKITCYFQIDSENLLRKELREREQKKISADKNENNN